jgi:hypothetical protein
MTGHESEVKLFENWIRTNYMGIPSENFNSFDKHFLSIYIEIVYQSQLLTTHAYYRTQVFDKYHV